MLLLCCIKKWFMEGLGFHTVRIAVCSLSHIMSSNLPLVDELCCRTASFIKSCLESDSPMFLLLLVMVFIMVV